MRHSGLFAILLHYGLPLLAFFMLPGLMKEYIAPPLWMDAITWWGLIDLCNPFFFWCISIFLVQARLMQRWMLQVLCLAQAWYLYSTLDDISTMGGYSTIALLIGWHPGSWVFAVGTIFLVIMVAVTAGLNIFGHRLWVDLGMRLRAKWQGQQVNVVRAKNDDTHGSADWATFEEVLEPGPIVDPNGPFVVGVAAATEEEVPTGKLIRVNPVGNGAITLMAGAGGGKTSGVVVPNCLLWPYSLFCYDPKGEIRAQVAKHRSERLGQKVFWLDPKAGENTHGFDVLSWLDPSREDIIGAADVIVASLFVNPPDASGDGSFWVGKSRDITKAAILWVFHQWHEDGRKGPRPTLDTVVNWLSRPDEEMVKDIQNVHSIAGLAIQQAFQTGDRPNFILDALFKLLGDFAKMDAEVFSKTRASYSNGVSWLADPSLNRLVVSNSFSVGDLLDQKTSVFLNFLPEDAARAPACIRVIVASFIGYQLRVGELNPVLYMLDEIVQLGNLELVHDQALQYGRSAGIVLCAVFQSKPGAEKAAGKEILDKWCTNSIARVFFRAQSPIDAKFVSELADKTTVLTKSTNTGENNSDALHAPMNARGGESTGISTQTTGRDLIMPGEVMRLPAWQSLVFISGKNPLRCGRADYYKRSEFRSIAAPNPFRPENKGLKPKMPDASLRVTVGALWAQRKAQLERERLAAPAEPVVAANDIDRLIAVMGGEAGVAGEAFDEVEDFSFAQMEEEVRSYALDEDMPEPVVRRSEPIEDNPLAGLDDADLEAVLQLDPGMADTDLYAGLEDGEIGGVSIQPPANDEDLDLDFAALERSVLIHAIGRRRAEALPVMFEEVFEHVGYRPEEEDAAA
ncbi:type IV secretory system conjugative DNA transfer family protein [Roseomonas genomospecies 6]|uniref:Type IV secretory system conjugative DNA transfer family protein n=1 Tax=Roseomonas genomospecies 6 TaxID=214106 RepID=A0A9W7KQP1_9PROT|nr:type IV secretory system conjugative DNA transfer family protein [Roseomonas genomospecies 6]KAA0677653.1 type IV secretory system conjugative DNA transfer family protein [Roseomonas genomospecies 6]